MNITDAISHNARVRAGHPAVEDGRRIVTYGALDGLVNTAAANLQAAGVGPGDFVAVLLPESADHLVVLCALARVGAIIFSQNPSVSRQELERNLASFAVKAVITAGPKLSGGDTVWLRAQDICQPGKTPFVRPNIGDAAPLVLIQSSGTTGKPKSFLRSHTEVGIWAARHTRNQGWSAAERCLSLVRLSFNMGLHNAFGMLQLGATVVVHGGDLDDALVALVREKCVSYLYLTPSHLIPLLHHAVDKAPLFPDLRMLVVASAPTTHAQRLLARERLCANVCEACGANEAGLLTFALPADQDAYPEAVGRLADNVEAQIVDEDDKPMPPGSVGHVRFRSVGYPTHYLDDVPATERAFRGGWFYPGDLAALNEAGYLFLKGRADDVINNSGAKFYPVEVEAALLAHPQIREAAVFGWPHKQHGQVAVACIVVDGAVTKKELQMFCARQIAGYKVPQRFAVMAELPKNAMGKIAKNELKEKFQRPAAARQVKR